ncbi:MAG TPA: zf-HC2 domain-containing protein [Candidatus Eisenbacteria bacterium]|nr:zf-HC2 domain-containing protein [Candidatus Eisenbacteria bacterium]
MIHLTVQQLSSYLDGQLVGSASDNVQSHLAACRDCSTRFALLERIEAILSDSLSIDPGDEFFRELEAEVGSRIRERGQRDKDLSTPAVSARYLESPTQARPANGRIDRAPNARTDHRPANTGADPRVVNTPARVSETRVAPAKHRAEAAPPQYRPAPKRSGSGAWLAFAALAVVAGSVGVVVSRTSFVSAWIAPHLGLGPEERSLASRALSPAVTPETTTTTDNTPNVESPGNPTPSDAGSAKHEWNPWEPPDSHSSSADEETAPDSAPDANDDQADTPEPSTMRADEVIATPDSSRRPRATASDPFRALGTESLGPVRAAQQLSDMANADPTATRFETAADGWERALDTMGGVPEQVAVRQLLADALYRAWQAEPTRARAESAKSAIKTYLLFAPSGWEREQAKTRLAKLGG